MTDLRRIPAELLARAAADPRNAHARNQLLEAAGEREPYPTPALHVEGIQGGKESAGECVTMVLPLPPSVNSYWRSVPATRNRIARVLISEQGRRFKRACQVAAQAQCKKPLVGDVSLRCVVYFKDRRRDLDNVCKPLLDALNGVAYGDDRQIVHIELTKRLDPKRPRVEVKLAAHP